MIRHLILFAHIAFFGLVLVAGCGPGSQRTPSETDPGTQPKDPASANNVLERLPADTVGFVHFRVDQFWNSKVGQMAEAEMFAEVPELLSFFEDQSGLSPKDIVSVTLIVMKNPEQQPGSGRVRPGGTPTAGSSQPGKPALDPFEDEPHSPNTSEGYQSPMAVITAAKSLQREKLLKLLDVQPGEEVTKILEGNTAYYGVGSPRFKAIYFPDDKTVVIGRPAQVRRFMTGPRLDPAGTPLASALKLGESGHWLFAGGVPAGNNPLNARKYHHYWATAALESAEDGTIHWRWVCPADPRSLGFSTQPGSMNADELKQLSRLIDHNRRLAELTQLFAALCDSDLVARAMFQWFAVLEREKNQLPAPRTSNNSELEITYRAGTAKISDAFKRVARAYKGEPGALRSAGNLHRMIQALHESSKHFGQGEFILKNGLSWRVQILPFLGEEELYSQFRQDLPWDHAHNMKLIEKMPAVFKLPGAKEPTKGSTYYVAFQGKATFLDGSVVYITNGDGAENTMAIVEAAEAVPWTRPVDFAYDPKKPLPKLGGHYKSGITGVAMADGTVRFLPKNWTEEKWKALITWNDGEPVKFDD